MVVGKRMLCRKCAKTYDNKHTVQQFTIDTGIPTDLVVKRRSCPICGNMLVELKHKK